MGVSQLEMYANLHTMLVKPLRRMGLGWTLATAHYNHAGKHLGEREWGRMRSCGVQMEVGE